VNTMLYYITLTSLCNQKCVYCGNTGDIDVRPINPKYTITELKRFLDEDPDIIICFYGGEPLLRLDLIKEIIDNIDASRFILQTNGLLLDRLEKAYLEKLDTILVSIDGRREITDYYRGEGSYDKVLNNIRFIRKHGFSGELIARMAVSSKTDIYLDVLHLLEMEDPRFDYVHWQLDALWDYPPYQRYMDFDLWLHNNYNQGITKLVRYWINNIIEKHYMPGIVPFLGISYSLITNKSTKLRCLSGIEAFAISTDGRILACPIAPEYSFNILGDIYKTSIKDLPNKIELDEPCYSCYYLWICGGRCLFTNKTKLWGLDGFMKVCESVKHLVNELMKYKELLLELIEQGYISVESFRYPKYPNSIEVIP